MKSLPSPEQRRETQAGITKSIWAWGRANKIATQPPTIQEISRTPIRSTKNIKNRAKK
jgi:hypothetical protein